MKTRVLRSTIVGLIFGIFLSPNFKAATYTATTSGNWSSAATWGGSAIGGTLSGDNVVIPSGITVSLDMDVSFTGALNVFTVNGTLNSSTTNQLLINSGNMAGSGTIDITRLRIGNSISATSSFTGNLTLNTLVNEGATFVVAGVTSVSDTLNMILGSIGLNTGANLSMENGSLIRIDNGSLGINGGIFNSGNSYSILYVGSSKNAGIELNSTTLQNVRVQLNDNNQTLTLGNDLTVNGTLYMNTGKLALNGKQLSLKGNLDVLAGAMFVGNSSSDIIIETNGSLTSGLEFSAGSSINNLMIDIDNANANDTVKLVSALTLRGQLQLTKGKLSLESGSTLTMNANSAIQIDNGGIKANGGSFVGTASYDLSYVGMGDTASVEMTGSGLDDVTINLDSVHYQIVLMSNTTIGGDVEMEKGRLNLNGKNLTLNGTFHQMSDASFVGHNSSKLVFNLTSASNDTMRFNATNQNLSKLRINLTSGDMVLGSALTIQDSLTLSKGRLNISDYMLTIQSTGIISAYNDNNYIIAGGAGKLKMRVNSASTYVTFPVGTSINYSPASIQQTSSGTSGDFMVNLMNGVYSQGTTGTNLALSGKVVDRTWLIESASGMNVNMNLRLGWKAASEVNNFDRTHAYISHYMSAAWDSDTSSTASAGAYSTFEITRMGVTSLSPFAVSDSAAPLKINEINETGVLKIYPNPSVDYVVVEISNTSDAYMYQLMDITGKIIIAGNASKNNLNRFDVSTLKAGYYFIRATNLNNQKTVTKRFVKS